MASLFRSILGIDGPDTSKLEAWARNHRTAAKITDSVNLHPIFAHEAARDWRRGRLKDWKDTGQAPGVLVFYGGRLSLPEGVPQPRASSRTHYFVAQKNAWLMCLSGMVLVNDPSSGIKEPVQLRPVQKVRLPPRVVIGLTNPNDNHWATVIVIAPDPDSVTMYDAVLEGNLAVPVDQVQDGAPSAIADEHKL